MRRSPDCFSVDQRKMLHLVLSKGERATPSANSPYGLSAARMVCGQRWDEHRQSIHLIKAIVMRRRTKIILAVIGVAIVWPFAQIGLIVAQAQYFAKGRPYCIELSSDRFLHYKPVASLMELNGITLRAPFVNSGGSGSHSLMQWTFHALLAIDAGSSPEWRNWSYWHQHFDWLTPQQAKATGLYRLECQPQADFVLKLPLFATR